MSSRREFLKFSGAAMLAGTLPAAAATTPRLPTRRIPGSDQELAIIGLGNSAAFRSGDAAVSQKLLDIFVDHGGNYIDVGGTSADFVGGLTANMGATDQIFFGNYIDPGELADMQSSAKSIADAQAKTSLDLVHTRNVDGYRASHEHYRALKESGLTRNIGVARTGNAASHAVIEKLVEHDFVDFIQVNFSMLELDAGERLLPLAHDKGVGVAISRPFINGDYFKIVRGKKLPDWAAEFDCATWAQFSLKFILANPAVSCVLTETANPKHALDNLGAGFGRLPDDKTRKRMLDHLQKIT